MARPDFLSQLPSLEELLENPRVAAAIERVNTSAAATQVRGAVSRLGSEIARRTDDLKGMGAGELFDRLLRQLDQPVAPHAHQAINATGQFFGAAGCYPPLSTVAIDAVHGASVGFRTVGDGHTAAMAVRLLGCEKAATFSSPLSALAVALEALAGGGACLVARGEMSELAPGVRLNDVARRSGVRLHEVGATDASTAADYEEALRHLRAEGVERCVVLRRTGAAGAGSPPLDALVAIADNHDALLIADVGGVPPAKSTPASSFDGPTAEEALSAGAAVVLINTAGRLGGPLGGIAAGQGSAIDVIAASAAARADMVEPFVEEALAATLGLFEHPEQLRFTHPLYQLLDAPLENLRVRAERIATLLSAAEGVASAVAVEHAASERPAWGVRVEPTPGATAADLRARLAGQDPRVEVATDASEVILNLATVFPSQDRALVGAFLPGGGEAGEPDLADRD